MSSCSKLKAQNILRNGYAKSGIKTPVKESSPVSMLWVMVSFGDHKQVFADLFELRFFFGPGYRIYYTIQNNEVVFLVAGGDKSSQDKDIKRAIKLLSTLEE